MKEYTPQQILSLPMDKNDAKADTIGQYLIRLSQQCWFEEEGFSGKRPFGNSGWVHELAKALIKAEAIDGELDEDGYIDDYSGVQLNKTINEVYEFLLNADYTTRGLVSSLFGNQRA
jgi:hypothetical protein